MNCLSCSKYLHCKDSKKDFAYSCTKFKTRKGYSFETVDANTLSESGLVSSETDSVIDHFDIQSIFKDAIGNDALTPKDIKIDDRDIWQAPNFLEFCTSHRGLKETLFTRQLVTGIILFSEWCPHCSDKEWFLNHVLVDDTVELVLEKVQLLEYGVCPRCKATKAEMIVGNDLPLYIELAACVGQRAGKSALVSFLIAYITHVILKLHKPNEVYKVGLNNTFHISLVALTLGQAKSTLWDPVYALLANSPWFKEYHKFLDSHGGKFGEVYKLQEMSVAYRHRSLIIGPQSPDMRKLRGMTRIAAAIDEIGWFDNNRAKVKVTLDATEIHKSLSNSLFTVRSTVKRLIRQGYSNVPTAYMLDVSSPSSVRDKIMELYKSSENSPHIYGIKLPTWEFNPNITRDDLDSAFREKPVEAERDFGANPPLSDNPFIGSFPRVELCFGRKRNPINIKYCRKKMRDGELTRFAKIASLKQGEYPSILAIDAGLCVTGDTLIPTSKGLLRIDQLVKSSTIGTKKLDLLIPGRNGVGRSSQWHYNGRKLTRLIKCSNGSKLKVTPDHKVLVLREYRHNWVESRSVKLTDSLCYTSTQTTRTDPLPLNIPDALKTCRVGSLLGKKKNVLIKPEYMTPDLAYLIGCIIADGYYSKYATTIISCNTSYIDHITSTFKQLLGVSTRVSTHTAVGHKYTIKKRSRYALVHTWSISVNSVTLSTWWEYLGLKKYSSKKVIPDCILQADTDSQLAFLAGYIESDGQIRKDRLEISIWSTSSVLRTQMTCLLGSHGIPTNINHRGDCITTTSAYTACNLYSKLKRFLIFKKADGYENRTRRSYKHGFPSYGVIQTIKQRLVRRGSAKYHALYLDDNGDVVSIQDEASVRIVKGLKTFNYKSYNEGKYSNFLKMLRIISREEYSNLVMALENQYTYTQVTYNKPHKKEHVYDITMAGGYDPSFVANNLIVHNCSNSFACVVGHLENDDDHPVIDLLLEIQPLPNIPLNYTKILDELLIPIIKARNVCLVVSDRWQHIKLLHDIEDTCGISTMAYSLKYNDMWIVRQMLYDNEMTLPKLAKSYDDVINYDFDDYPYCFAHDPVSHLVLQMLTVKDTGNQVIKGENLTDDILRALFLIITMMSSEEYKNIVLSTERREIPSTFLAKLRLKSSGVTSMSSGSKMGSDGRVLGKVRSRSG